MVVYAVVLLLLLAGCSHATPMPPTVTPTATTVALPSDFATALLSTRQAVVVVMPPSPPKPEPLPSSTPLPPPTATEIFSLPGYAVVTNETPVSLYQEPDTAYPQVGLWAKDIPLPVEAKTTDNLWLRVCCFRFSNDTQPVALWVQKEGVREGDVAAVAVATNEIADRFIVRETATPSPAPPDPVKPFVEVIAGQTIAALSGPGPSFASVAILGAGIPIEVNGQTADGFWLRLCCLELDGGPMQVWVARNNPAITILNDELLRLSKPIVPPTPPPTAAPFSKTLGPEYYNDTQPIVTVLAKVYVGDGNDEQALPGYLIAAEFKADGGEVVQKRLNGVNEQVSVTSLAFAFTDRYFNYKYINADGVAKGTWRIWLTNAEGYNLWLQNDPTYKNYLLSEEVTFTTDPGNPNRLVYLAWRRVG